MRNIFKKVFGSAVFEWTMFLLFFMGINEWLNDGDVGHLALMLAGAGFYASINSERELKQLKKANINP